jgi:hypothetical protein
MHSNTREVPMTFFYVQKEILWTEQFNIPLQYTRTPLHLWDGNTCMGLMQ